MVRFIVLVLASIFANGGLAATTAASTQARQPIASRNGGWMDARANPKHTWMYVVGYKTNAVSIYDLSRFSMPKIGSISQGIDSPVGDFVDAQGNLYVTNRGSSNDVSVYPPGATSPSLVLGGLTSPAFATVDVNGDVYVGDFGTSPKIAVYAQGQTTPYRTIADPLIQSPRELQFDSQRNLFFSDNATGVSEIPFDSQTVSSLGLQGLTDNSGLALDLQNGRIFTSSIAHAPQIAVYKPGTTKPARWISGSSADLLTVTRIQRTDYLLAPNTVTNFVVAYKAGSTKLVFTLATDVQYLISAAIKAAGVP